VVGGKFVGLLIDRRLKLFDEGFFSWVKLRLLGDLTGITRSSAVIKLVQVTLLRVLDLTWLSKVSLRCAYCIVIALSGIFLRRSLLFEKLELTPGRLLSIFSLDSRKDLGLLWELVFVAIDVYVFIPHRATAILIKLIVRVLSHLVFFVVISNGAL